MARPREFDIDEALDAAMQPFWEHGYEATSLADLMKATGLQKGSIYKAFGSKHALFVRVLTRYLDQLHGEMRAAIEGASSPVEAIRRYLELVQRLGSDGAVQQGCLAVNTLVELAPHDEEVRETLRHHQMRVARALTATLEEGQVAGDFRQDATAGELATYLMTTSAGLVAVSKSSPAFTSSSIVDLMLSALRA